MKLNVKDSGNRKFILCTNNENNICRDITYERIKRVIDQEGYSASLKYYKVDYIPIFDRMYYEYAEELLKHICELVELENGVNFTGNAEIGIVLTEEELADFMTNIEAYGKCRKLYMGHDLLPDVMTGGFEENDNCFINWEKLTKKGNNALKDSERTNFLEHIEHALNAGLHFVVIVDESHQNNTVKADEIIQYFHTDKIIRCSAIPERD